MENQNNILPKNTIPPQKGSNTKVYILFAASFLIQAATWILMQKALTIPVNPVYWIYAGIAAAFAVSITTLFLLVKKSRGLGFLLILLSAGVYVAVSPRNVYVWLGGVVFALFALWYESKIAREANSRLDFSLTSVVNATTSILIYGILLLLGFNIYYTVSADFRNNPDKYYDRLGVQAARTIPYLSRAIPDSANLNQPLSEYFEHQAAEKQILTDQAREEFEREFEISASGDQTLSQIMAQVAVNKIRQAAQPFQAYLPLIFAILVVGLLYTFAFLIRWAILLISWVLFRALLAGGFFKLEKVKVEVEKLTI